MDYRIFKAVCGVAIGGLAGTALANPYAGTITEAGGTVSFRLNEAADEVIVIRDGVSSSLGALGVGLQSFPRNGAANYSIVVRKNAGDGYQTASSPNVASVLQISDDNAVANNIDRAPGLAIYRNPANPALFGRLYFTAPRDFTTGLGRPITQGVFIINPDGTEAIAGQGANGMTGGISFIGGTDAVSPWRMALDDDGNVYIGDWSDPNGSIFRTGPDVGSSGGVNLFVGLNGVAPINPSNTLNHGSNTGLAITGGPSTNNLTVYTIDEDLTTTGGLSQLNSLWRYDMGNSTGNFDGIPTRLSGNLIDFTEGIQGDLARGPDGKLYQLQNRFDGNESGVFINAADGTTLYASLADSQARGIDGNLTLDGVQDVFTRARNITTSPDGRWLVVTTSLNQSIVVPLLAGIPDIANRLQLNGFVLATNDAASFDAAGNLAIGNRSEEFIRTFSPGGVSVTAYNSNGTFVADPSYTAGAGNYTTAGSWLAGIVPNGVNQTARFGGTGGAVNMNVATTLGALKFDSASSYTLSGSQITLQGGSPHIISSQGNHTVSAPVLLKQSAGLVANGGVLTINDLSVDGAATVPVEVYTGGTGVVAVNKVVGPALHVVSGTTRIISNGTSAATSKVNVLRFYGGATPQGKLDLTNNAFVVDYPAADAEPFDTIKTLITSGYAGGAWTGNGITSSTAAGGGTHGVGYAEASALTSVPAIFGSVDASSVLMRYTRYGDANLDGNINLADFNRLAANFGASSGANWDQGDFNYDSAVTLTDFNRLAANFGLSASPGGPTPEDWATLAAAIPEPSSLALVGLASAGLLRRRRRN